MVCYMLYIIVVNTLYVLCVSYHVVYDAFEHWKELVKLLCCAEDALSAHKDLFVAFIGNKSILLQNPVYKPNKSRLLCVYPCSCSPFSTQGNSRGLFC